MITNSLNPLKDLINYINYVNPTSNTSSIKSDLVFSNHISLIIREKSEEFRNISLSPISPLFESDITYPEPISRVGSGHIHLTWKQKQ